MIFCFVSKFKIPDRFKQRKIENLIFKCAAGDAQCQFTGTLIKLAEHHNSHFKVKQKISIKCQHCSLKFRNSKEYEKHLDAVSGNCFKQPLDCVFKTIGCHQNGLNHENISTHVYECHQYHLNLIHG